MFNKTLKLKKKYFEGSLLKAILDENNFYAHETWYKVSQQQKKT